MNNSKIAIENVSLELEKEIDYKPMWRERETELQTLIEALQHIASSDYWKLLQDKIFFPDLQELHNELGKEKDSTEIFRLQGKINWIENHLDLSRLLLLKRNELNEIRKNLHGENN